MISTSAKRKKLTKPAFSPVELATTWQAVSLLLDYPSEEAVGRHELIKREIETLPSTLKQPLLDFIEIAQATDLRALQIKYVDTFDITRKCSLFLSYYLHGDTRRRGVALVQFKQAYRKGGVEISDDELPDHLAVLCEFGAVHNQEIAWQLFNDNRIGIEMLRIALQDLESPWLNVILALTATLPQLDGSGEEAVLKLINEGPPTEEVGLDNSPYSMDPRANPRPETGALL